jgi:hypothetical protein
VQRNIFLEVKSHEFPVNQDNPIIDFPVTLPINLGPFVINASPNKGAYFQEVMEGQTEIEIDHNYPLSVLYLDFKEGEHVTPGTLGLRSLRTRSRVRWPPCWKTPAFSRLE